MVRGGYGSDRGLELPGDGGGRRGRRLESGVRICSGRRRGRARGVGSACSGATSGHGARRRGAARESEFGENLLGVELQEARLVPADLVDEDMGEAGVLVLLDRVEVLLRIRAADDLLGHVVFGDGLGGGLVVLGGRELLAERAA